MKDLRKFYVDGEWVDPICANDLAVENPATEELVATISLGAMTDVNRAVACLLYTSPSPRDPIGSRMPSSA